MKPRHYILFILPLLLGLLGAGLLQGRGKANSLPGLRYDFMPSTGQVRLLVILMNFSDTQPSVSGEEISDLYFSRGKLATGSMAEYYDEVSYGRLELSGEVLGWYTAQHEHDYYSDSKYGQAAQTYPRNQARLVEEAVKAAAAAGVNFSFYDNSGDGHVDGLVIIHQGPGGDTSGNRTDLWSSLGYLSDKGARPLEAGGITIDRFVIAQEVWKNKVAPIGFVGHEVGHLMGLPDLYDGDRSSAGIGRYGIMSAGMWSGDPRRPAHPTAFNKALLGWIEPELITRSGTITLGPSENIPQAVRINTEREGEYFLLENRAKMGYDENLPARGLFIWHVDETVLEQNRFECKGCCEHHARVALEQADGRNDLELGSNWGDSLDAFPGPGGSNKDFRGNTGTGPDKREGAHSLDYDCDLTGIGIKSIKLKDSQISARVELNDRATPFKTPDLRVLDLHWKELDGNGNGRPDPGEKLKLYVDFRNNGEKGKKLKAVAGASGLIFEKNSIDLGSVDRGLDLKGAGPLIVCIPEALGTRRVEFDFEIRTKRDLHMCNARAEVLIGTPEILILDDSRCLFLSKYYRSVLDRLHEPYIVYDVKSDGLPDADFLAEFKILIWLAGLQGQHQPFPDIARRELLEGYLDAHGKLFLVAPNLHPEAGAHQGFLSEYLHIRDVAARAGIGFVRGEMDDPISRGLSGALSSLYFPDLIPHAVLRPTADATSFFCDQRGDVIGLRYSSQSGSKLVVMSFPVEGLAPGLRKKLVERTLLYLRGQAIQAGGPTGKHQ